MPGRESLMRERAKIAALLPLSSGARRDQLALRLERINRELGLSSKKRSADYRSVPPEILRTGVMGVGALGFQVLSPPGPGRLVRVPMYLDTTPAAPAQGTVSTDGGVNAVALVNPITIITFNQAAVSPSVVTGLRFSTRQIPWSEVRIVGFETTQRYTPSIADPNAGVPPIAVPGAPIPPAFLAAPQYRPFSLVRDLQVGGGANLFCHENYVDATVYAAKVPEFPGLRDNPVINRTNVVTVRGAFMGPGEVNPGGLRQVGSAISFSCALVCEVLEDDDFGAVIPGPYARSQSMARDSVDDGGGFVEG